MFKKHWMIVLPKVEIEWATVYARYLSFHEATFCHGICRLFLGLRIFGPSVIHLKVAHSISTQLENVTISVPIFLTVLFKLINSNIKNISGQINISELLQIRLDPCVSLLRSVTISHVNDDRVIVQSLDDIGCPTYVSTCSYKCLMNRCKRTLCLE